MAQQGGKRLEKLKFAIYLISALFGRRVGSLALDIDVRNRQQSRLFD
jgi:hypothetical protein